MGKSRIIGLDAIRGIAILLVLFRHGDYVCFLNKIGWIGVDLFFVLSGFLVSNLVFREFKEKGEINIKRFLIRRSLKIMPSFYFFTLIFIGLSTFFLNEPFDRNLITHELLYIQNYFSGINGHTWSLAVEEQFYLGFAGLVFLAYRLKLLNLKAGVILFLIGLILGVALWRASLAFGSINASYVDSYIRTHLRIDGILLGVLFSYCYHFTRFNEFIRKKPLLVLALALALISPVGYLVAGEFYMSAFGMFSANLGFAFLVILIFNSDLFERFLSKPVIKPGVNIIAFIGIHSYTIYLWHILVKQLIPYLQIEEHVADVLYFLLTIGIGVLISVLFEKPVLRFRNKVFP